MSRPHDLAPVESLAHARPHGHKMRYMAGCRCARCRRGNALYEQTLNEARALYGPNDLVSTDLVRLFLQCLKDAGIGHKTVAKVTGVGKTCLAEILWYGKDKMRRRAEARVLAFRPSLETYPKTKPIPATETLAKLRQLMRWGIPRSLISRDGLGSKAKTSALQIRCLEGLPTTMARSALLVRDYFARVEKMRAIWMGLGRTIPADHYVYWKPGRRGMTVRSFELRPFPRTYDYAVLYPPELKQAIRLAGILERKIRSRTNGEHEKQDIGFAGSSVRGAGSAEGHRQAAG